MDLEYLETREGPFKENSRQRCYGRDILLSDNAFKKSLSFFPWFFQKVSQRSHGLRRF
jgi:hypothetical protein